MSLRSQRTGAVLIQYNGSYISNIWTTSQNRKFQIFWGNFKSFMSNGFSTTCTSKMCSKCGEGCSYMVAISKSIWWSNPRRERLCILHSLVYSPLSPWQAVGGCHRPAICSVYQLRGQQPAVGSGLGSPLCQTSAPYMRVTWASYRACGDRCSDRPWAHKYATLKKMYKMRFFIQQQDAKRQTSSEGLAMQCWTMSIGGRYTKCEQMNNYEQHLQPLYYNIHLFSKCNSGLSCHRRATPEFQLWSCWFTLFQSMVVGMDILRTNQNKSGIQTVYLTGKKDLLFLSYVV